MGIRIAERAKISPRFKDAVVALSVERLMQIRDEIETKYGEQRALYKKEMAPTIIRLGKLAKSPTEELDMIITRLRGLPYTEFDVIEYPGHSEALFLAGTTKNVEIRYSHDIYNMGPYSARIPFSILVGTINRRDHNRLPGESWHFIPLNKEDEAIHRNDYRHPHHYGIWPDRSSTCWGDFNMMISDLTRAADIPELFRTIYIYLSRYDSHSVLHGHVENGYFPWAVVRRAGAHK